MTPLEKRIANVMSKIFDVPAETINTESSPDTIATWDSLHHLNLAVALEEEFKTEFTEDEIMELMNFKLIVITLKEKNVQ